jgi:hypothetical protein
MIRTLVLTAFLCWTISDAAAAPLKPLKMRVGRLQREALLHIPAGAAAEKLPVVFVFHGHGGSALKAAENFAVHEHWPEALCVYIAGENDNTVAFEIQQKSMDNLRKRNGCEDSGQPWNNGKAATATLYPSPTGTPFVSVVHSSGHEVPVFAGRMMARFFKGNAKPERP